MKLEATFLKIHQARDAGKMMRFLKSHRDFLSIYPRCRNEIIESIDPKYYSDVKCLIELAKDKIFTFEEIRPVVWQCIALEAVIQYNMALFDQFKHHDWHGLNWEILREIENFDSPSFVYHPKESRNWLRRAKKLPEIQDQLEIFRLMES